MTVPLTGLYKGRRWATGPNQRKMKVAKTNGLMMLLAAVAAQGETNVTKLATKLRDVNQSTVDNWISRAVELGLIKRTVWAIGSFTGEMKGKRGRPPASLEITAKGSKALQAGEIKGLVMREFKTRTAAPAKASKPKAPKAKAAKAKASKPKAEPKPAKAPKAKAGLTPEQKTAKAAKDKARRALAKAPAAPEVAPAAATE